MWHIKTTTVDIIIGALNTIKKYTEKNIKKIHGRLCLQYISRKHCVEQFIYSEGIFNAHLCK